MTEGTPWKHILLFALPVLAGSLLQQLYNTVDTIIVGNFVSQAALSAVGTTASVAFFFLAIAMGFSAGNGVVVAQHYGAGEEDEVRKNAAVGIFFLMILGIGATVLGLALTYPIYGVLLSVPDTILSMTVEYFLVYSVGFVFQYGYNVFASILRAVGDSAATLYFLLISSVVNVVLDLLFIVVFKWGVIGAAFATDLAQAGSFVAAYFYMTKKYPLFRFQRKDFKWDNHRIGKTVQAGFPIAIQLCIVSTGLTFIQRAVNEFGDDMIASATVGQRVEMYLNLPGNAFQTTLATYTGQNVGAGKINRVNRGVRQTMLMSAVMTLVISLLIYFYTAPVIALFSLNESATVLCDQHLKTIAFVNAILSMYVPLFGVFQGANHPAFPTVVATSALGIRVVVTYLFRYSSFFGQSIIWWNGLFGFGLGFLISWSYYLSGKWKKNSSIKR